MNLLKKIRQLICNHEYTTRLQEHGLDVLEGKQPSDLSVHDFMFNNIMYCKHCGYISKQSVQVWLASYLNENKN